MDQYTRLNPKLLEELRKAGPRHLPVVVHVNGNERTIGTAEISFDDEGMHIHTALVDERWTVLFDQDVQFLSFGGN